MARRLALVIFIFSLAIISSLGYVYFFQISPTFVEKPELEKPTQKYIGTEHVIYLLNEIDAYKLHPNPLTSEIPIIEVVVGTKSYMFAIMDNEIIDYEGDPDLLISGDEKILESVLSSEDISSAIIDAYHKGLISIEIYADESNLALKGYKGIYDKFGNKVTGEIVALKPKGAQGAINLSMMFFMTLIMGLVLERL